jgi:hypothetical protein
MGSLLAISPTVSESTLGLETSAGDKLFHALQDYGAYIGDGTAWGGSGGNGEFDWPADTAALSEFSAANNYSFAQSGTAFRRDLDRLVPLLMIVNNNAAASIGGGGTPRQPLAPPLP